MNVRPFKHILTNLKTGQVKTLTAAPGDWDDLTTRHFRHLIYKSVLREDNLAQRFVLAGGASDEGGYYFLWDAYIASGTKALIQYERKALNPNTNDYDIDVVGMVDFSANSGWSFMDEWAEFKINDSSKLAKFIARDDVAVNVFGNKGLDGDIIPSLSNPFNTTLYKGIDITLIGIANGSMTATSPLSMDTYFNVYYAGEITRKDLGQRFTVETADETIYSNSLVTSSNIKLTIPQSNLYILFNADSNFFVNATYTFDIVVSIYTDQGALSEENVLLNGSFPFTLEPGNESEFFLYNLPVGPFILNRTIPIDYTVGFRVQHRVTGFGTPTLGVTQDYNIDGLEIIETTLGAEDNDIKGFYIHDLIGRATQLITGEINEAKVLDAPIIGKPSSSYTNYPSPGGTWSDLFVTNGQLLRTKNTSALNTSVRDAFNTLSAIDPVGLYYNKQADIFEINDVSTYFKSEYFPFNLGEVKDLKIMPAKEFYFNKILSGWLNIENEDFQGVDDPNSAMEHSASFEEKNNLDLRAPFSGSGIAQELARRIGDTSEDSRYDDKNFIVDTNGTQTLQGNVSDPEGYEWVQEDYNLRLNARDNLIRNAYYWFSALGVDVNEFIQFANSKKQTDFSYIRSPELLRVGLYDDITQASFSNFLFDAEYYEFEAPYTKEIRDAIKLDPHRIIPFYGLNEDRFGDIWEIEGNSYKNIATYKLIRTHTSRL